MIKKIRWWCGPDEDDWEKACANLCALHSCTLGKSFKGFIKSTKRPPCIRALKYFNCFEQFENALSWAPQTNIFHKQTFLTNKQRPDLLWLQYCKIPAELIFRTFILSVPAWNSLTMLKLWQEQDIWRSSKKCFFTWSSVRITGMNAVLWAIQVNGHKSIVLEDLSWEQTWWCEGANELNLISWTLGNALKIVTKNVWLHE